MKHLNKHQARIAQIEADRELIALARGAAQHLAGAAAQLRQETRQRKLLKAGAPMTKAYRLGAGAASVGRQQGRRA